jgi:hypothetical protein
MNVLCCVYEIPSTSHQAHHARLNYPMVLRHAFASLFSVEQTRMA